ncbi:MAG TPA: hypothetical protein DEZ08_04685 [Dehalococcoidia bacterium]|jgi:uncharacterized membrane protein YhaH (DUF805 family)|nr:hypothetical protein [Dehalococcoidia bacterium]|tara:strand:- start:4447 stop:4860 length:414 start_codon:yes stop_codon:yes gene_type:complete
MNIKNAIIACFYKYFEFNGRSSRKECWWFILFTYLVSWSLELMAWILMGEDSYWNSGYMKEEYPLGLDIIIFLWAFIVLIPTLAVTSRRMHDISKSGWNQLWILTIVGIIWVIWIMIKNSDPHPNKYGNIPHDKTSF